ncbi:MAG: MMPL family transporter, partial [Candidatus Latescibacteria bacterium]|nr:MMPL family transporter [bacterium]MBD3423381.1 MMPL family transporter [Candidatus Latescibacterota bacterium]
MNLFRIFIRKPVLTTMILVALLVLGVNSYRDMIVEMMPQIDLPFVVVTTVYPGASPEEIESQITKKIEDEIATIANVKKIESTSMENMSQVIVEFELETDVDMDAIDVKDKVDAILSDLPEDAERPIIQKWDINAIPIIELTVSAPRPLQEVYRISDRVIKERLSRIGGVGEVEITGKREREIRVEVQQERLRAYGLGLLDIVGIVSAENLNVPAGHITRGASETTIRMVGEVNAPSDLAKLRIPLPGGSTIPLSEIADIVDGTEELREYSSFNGEPVIGLSIIKRSDGNTVSIGRDVHGVLEELRAELDPDISIEISQDSSTFVIDAVNDVLQNIGLGILLTSILLLIFLHNWRQMIVAALSMPTSVIATFLLIEASNFSVNIMTLMALGISIGTLVTNSILIIENITRFVKKGMDPFEAAEKGTSEVAVAVIASTLTNIVVFTPIAFMSGIIGRFFIQFGLTVVYATIFSLIIGFTMVPMLSARILKPREDEKEESTGWWVQLTRRWDQFYVNLSNGYRNLLDGALRHKWIPLVSSVAAFIFAIFLITTIGGEFMPLIDQNFFVIGLELPAGTSLDRTRELSGR